MFVVFVFFWAPGGCAHFKGPSELWGLETWDCAAQLAQRTRVHPENASRAGVLGRDELPQTFTPFHRRGSPGLKPPSLYVKGKLYLWLVTSRSTISATRLMFRGSAFNLWTENSEVIVICHQTQNSNLSHNLLQKKYEKVAETFDTSVLYVRFIFSSAASLRKPLWIAPSWERKTKLQK